MAGARHPGLILDRDGTLTYERGYLSSANDLVPLPGVEVAMRRARVAGVRLAVVTNQSAVARGVVTEMALRRMHDRIRHLFRVDAIYHCPHLPDTGCRCRKPAPGMVQQALTDLDLDPRRSLVVGDHLTDCIAGRAASVEAMLVRTGHGYEHAAEAMAGAFRVVADLPEAVDIFLARLRSRHDRRDGKSAGQTGTQR